MTNQMILNNARYSLSKVRDIVNLDILLNYKNVKSNKCNKLINNMIYKFQPINPLYFIIYKNRRYIIDGYKRLDIYKSNNIFKDYTIPIVEIIANNENEIQEYFNLINNSSNDLIKNIEDIEMEDISMLEKEEIIINSTYDHFITHYPNSFKYNGKRRPYINESKFEEDLKYIYNNNSEIIKTSDDFINILLNLNNSYKEQKLDWFPSKNKINNKELLNILQVDNCLYFGMLPNEWIKHIKTGIPKTISENKISQSLRQQVWVKYANNKLEIKCICCNLNTINAFTFESGHIIATSKGGECNIDNLVPICGLCNKSMGNINMKEFILNHNYKLHPKI